MINRGLTRRFVAVITMVVMLVISSRSARATAEVRLAALSILGVVEVNGEQAISGGTFTFGSRIVTHEASEATINPGGSVRVALSANSALKLSSADNGLQGQLDEGEVLMVTPAGVSVSLVLPGGGVVLVDGTQSTAFTVSVQNGAHRISATRGSVEFVFAGVRRMITAGANSFADAPQNQPNTGHSRKAVVALLIAAGAAVAAVIWVVTHDSRSDKNEMNFGGTVIVPSG